jgi:hypothetical protein
MLDRKVDITIAMSKSLALPHKSVKPSLADMTKAIRYMNEPDLFRSIVDKSGKIYDIWV